MLLSCDLGSWILQSDCLSIPLINSMQMLNCKIANQNLTEITVMAD